VTKSRDGGGEDEAVAERSSSGAMLIAAMSATSVALIERLISR
jgi:hypothetical protein